jgi:hypothetical protein
MKERIKTAVASIDDDMLLCVWNEFSYPTDICNVTMLIHRTLVTQLCTLEDVD